MPRGCASVEALHAAPRLLPWSHCVLSKRTVTVAPDSALGHYVAGVMAYERGDGAVAEPELRAAIERDSTMARARAGSLRW